MTRSHLYAILLSILSAGQAYGVAIYPESYGAVADGTALCTSAIQQAINAAGPSDSVVFRSGRYLSGTVYLKSNLTLQVDQGETLLGSSSMDDYPLLTPSIASTAPTYRSLLYADHMQNVTIRGNGTIDGQGGNFSWQSNTQSYRPKIIGMLGCNTVSVSGINFRNSGSWMQQYLQTDNLNISDISVYNHPMPFVSANNDGIDIDSCHDVNITRVAIDSYDDAICLKSTTMRATKNVSITDSVARSQCNAFKCGTDSLGGFENISISNCTLGGMGGLQYHYAAIALEIVDGGTMKNVNIDDITIEPYSLSPIFVRLGNRGRHLDGDPVPDVGTIDGVTISNVTATGAREMGCPIAGIADHRIKNLTLRNIDISTYGGGSQADADRDWTQVDERAGAYPESNMFGHNMPASGMFFWHVDGLTMDNVNMHLMPGATDARPQFAYLDVVQTPEPGGLALLFMGLLSLLAFAGTSRARSRRPLGL